MGKRMGRHPRVRHWIRGVLVALAVVGALQGGATPYYTSYVNGLVKLTYNASYRFREVYE